MTAGTALRALVCASVGFGLMPLAYAGSVTVSPTSLSFGSQVLGAPSAVKKVTLTNGQTKSLTITSITATLSDYTQTNNCSSTLAAGASCTISVTFTPAALGLRSATLKVNDNATNSPQQVTLSGTGIAAVTATPTSVSFGNVTVGTKSSSKTVTVQNNQATSVTISSIIPSPSDYSYTTGCGSTLGAGKTCTISVFFTPATTGLRSGTLTVNTTAGNPAVSLSGTGIQPAVVNPGSLTFAGQALGTTSPGQTVTLTNNQTTTLKITSISSSVTDFNYTTNCPLSPSTLGAGASCTATVTFSPKATGTRTGTLSFTDNANNSPQTVSLTGTGNPATLVSIAVTPANPSVAAGLTEQFTATGTYTDGTTQNLTNSATWTSSATGVATVSSAGLATTKAQGTTTITATSGSVSGSTVLTVTPPTLVSIAVTPASPSVAAGLTQQFTATGTYTDGTTQNLTNSATWTSSATAVATIASSGLATTKAQGTTTITATSGSVGGSTVLTVNTPTLVSIAVTPANPSIAAGLTEQFTATGTYTDGTTQNLTSSATWTSSATAVATIASSGLATSKTQGTTTIAAASGLVSGSTVLTVTPPTLVSIAVTPANPSVAAGLTEQFTATGTYTDGSTQNLTNSATWTSSATAVATVSSAGLATSKTQGTTTITATSGSVSGSTVLTVTAPTLVSIAVTPANPSIAAGLTQQFTATGTYTDGTTQNLTNSASWTSSSTAVATISSAGLATSKAQGTTSITATSGPVSGSSILTVTAPTLVSIAVTPAGPSVAAGLMQQFTATGTYTDGSTQNLTNSATWSSSATAVATIASSGLATTAAQGATTITAGSGTISGATTLTVSSPNLVSIAVTPANPSFSKGTTQQLAATGTYTDGSTLDITASVLWSTGNSSVATVNSTGLASSVAVGSTTATATSGGVSGSTTLTVTPAALVSIAVTPALPGIPLGTTQQFTATGTYTDGSTQNITTTVTWSSSQPSIATISNNTGSQGLATSVAIGPATITAAVGAITGSTTLTVAAASLVSIAVTPAAPSIALGTTQQFTATGTFTDGSTQNLTSSVTWNSDTSTVASVNGAGLATSIGTGTANITAASGTVSGSTVLIVTAAQLVSIAVTPSTAAIPAGTTQQFTAFGTYTDGTTQDLTTTGHWSSSDGSAATVSNTPGSQGLASALTAGTATISISSGEVTGSATLTVTAAALVSIAITPQAPAITLGNSQQFIATGTYTDSSTQNITGQVNWSSSNAAVAVISNAAGSNGLATSAGAGAATITATLGTVSASTTLTVTSAALVSISVSPANISVLLGAAQPYTATGTYSDNSTQDLTTSVTWSTSNAAVASISNQAGSNGLVTGVGTGVATVTATLGAVSGSTTVNVYVVVLTSIAVTPAAPSIAFGATQQFAATGTYSDGSTQDLTALAAWNSSAPSVATISAAGLASAVAAGSTSITAAFGLVSSPAGTLTVGAPALVSIAVTPASPSFASGTIQPMIATGTYADGSTLDLTNSVSWSSGNTGIATVSASGALTGVSVGSATVTAISGAISGSTTATVTPAALVSIVITPADPSTPLGTTQQLTATGQFADGSTQNITQTVQWSSGTASVATISNAAGSQGQATSLATGTTTLTATSGSVSASTTLTVTAAVLASINVTPANPSIALGTTQQFTATGNFTDGSTQDLTATAAWASDTTVATISTAGFATNAGAGTANITATSGGVSGSTVLTVTVAQLVSIAVNPAVASVAAGATQQFTATGTYTDGTTQDVTQTGHWSSSNAAVATISNTAATAGLATTFAAGSTTISIASGAVSGSATLTANPAALVSIAITPASQTISLGQTQQFAATGTYADGTSQDVTSLVTWTSSAPAVAVISNAPGSSGLATSAATGTATISAALGTVSNTATLTVGQPTLSYISVTPAAPVISVGFSQQFAATAVYTDGSTQDVTQLAVWTSSLPSIANIASGGLATSNISPGTTTITANWSLLGGSTSLTTSVGGQQYTKVFVVFPPSSGTNNAHFMNTVINQAAIDGVTLQTNWSDVETATPGLNTCSPVGTDTCQMDAFGYTHSYNWSTVDGNNAQWFATGKKVNILLFGIGGAGSTCLGTDSCANTATPYYVNTTNWITEAGATSQDVINGVKDGCTNWFGKKTTSMTRTATGLVTVTRNNHPYKNGDIVWIGGTTPSSYNIAQAAITSVQEVSATSTLSITANQSYPVGMAVTFHGLNKASFLNGVTVTVASSTATQFTATFVYSNYGPKAETAGTATPAGAVVQNATTNTFQYQSGSLTAGSATTPGQIISPSQSWPVPYEPAYKQAWKPFIAAALLHFANNPQVDYIRVGRSVGGEAFPYCTGTLKTLPSPNTYSKTVWLNYYAEISDFVQSQNPTMQVLDPLNSAEAAPDYTYGTDEAAIAVAHVNGLGDPDGFGSQGLRASDITNYNQNPPQYCSSDWCGTFNTYDSTVYPLQLQQTDLSSPNGLYAGSNSGDLRSLLPFAVTRHMAVLELYYLDALLAYDPNYCVLTVPNTGVCASGSISIPTSTLPLGYQYPYFQVVGQPGQPGATGDGSYATSINATHGAH